MCVLTKNSPKEKIIPYGANSVLDNLKAIFSNSQLKNRTFVVPNRNRCQIEHNIGYNVSG